VNEWRPDSGFTIAKRVYPAVGEQYSVASLNSTKSIRSFPGRSSLVPHLGVVVPSAGDVSFSEQRSASYTIYRHTSLHRVITSSPDFSLPQMQAAINNSKKDSEFFHTS